VRKALLSSAIGLLLVLAPSFAHAAAGEADITPLSNKDVLVMVQKHVSEEVIIKAIKTSPCTFDIFPPVLQDMKRRGVSDAVLQAMIEAPYGPAVQTAASSADELGEQPIYHYADQLTRLGYIAPSTSRRQPARFPRRNDRMRATRDRRP
jgi:hypothetical protein